MSSISVFKYKNYRTFLSDWIKAKGFSYRTFAKKYGHIVSLNALARTLSRGNSKNRAPSSYRMSPETLAQLGKAIGLKEDEVTYLILLRLQNESESRSGPHGSALGKSLQSMLRVHEEKTLAPKADPQARDLDGISLLCAEVFQQLPHVQRLKVADRLLREARVFVSRQTSRIGIKAFEQKTHRVEQFLQS
ncbi:hypothetical protein K2X30_08455 [bacterium]|nr:hypothetical protein [bacterium]